MIDAAELIARHYPNVQAYRTHRITSANEEELDSKIATVEKRAFGNRNSNHFRIAVNFHCGGHDLDLSALTHRKSDEPKKGRQ